MLKTVAVNRKEQIRTVAQNLFRERGYSATSMRDLARQVGIEPASLYSHISSKEEILNEICFRIAGEFFEAMEPVMKTSAGADEKLNMAIISHIRVIKNNLDASAVFLHEWRFLTEPEISRFKSERKRYENLFRQILEDGMQSGIFRNINLKIILPTLFSAMNWTYEWHKPEKELNPERIGSEIFELVFSGIRLVPESKQ